MIVTEITTLKEAGLQDISDKYEVQTFVRKGYETKADIAEGEHAIISYINTLALDRDNEVVLPSGAEMTDYRNTPVVLWAHKYDGLPRGKNMWIKADKKGLIAKTVYANHEEARKVYDYRKDGFPLANSIGFIPLEYESSGNSFWSEKTDNWEDTLKEWKANYREVYGKRPKGEPDTIYTKWILLEYSDVPVPSNPEAIQLAISKGLIQGKMKKELEARITTELKSVIPYKDLGKEPEDYIWDATAEVKAATVEDLKLMAAWYDKENPDVKASYKLPHHTAKGHKSVWRGVSAAMGALLGARGGVNVPDSDRKGIYNHLAKHYKEFDKEAPDFKSVDDDVILLSQEPQIIEIEKDKEPEIDIKGIIENEIEGLIKQVDENVQKSIEKAIDKLYGHVY